MQLYDRNVEIVEATATQGQRLWLVACPALFGRSGNPYVDVDGTDWPDNAERFALLSRAVVWLATHPVETDFRADVVHLNDWQTGLAAALLAREPSPPPTVFTIHNLAYQGVFERATFDRLGLPLGPVVDRGPGVPWFDGVHQGRYRVCRPYHHRQSQLRCRNPDTGVRPGSRWIDTASRFGTAWNRQRHRYVGVESDDRPAAARAIHLNQSRPQAR